jgi:imidazole glycerol-phosphate synthase subunit HisH
MELLVDRSKTPRIAIVDYDMGNLFSVKHACEHFGIDAFITASRNEISAAQAVILPGVGAFGDAIDSLKRLDLFTFLVDVALSSKPFIGICLGMQLLMEKSYEFGNHDGLGLIKGSVVQFKRSADNDKSFKVPQVGWNRIFETKKRSDHPWKTTFLKGLNDGDFMYFVHSFYVTPAEPDMILSKTNYGNIEFCSSLQCNNIFACQFHPERSGVNGLKIYKNISDFIKKSETGE